MCVVWEVTSSSCKSELPDAFFAHTSRDHRFQESRDGDDGASKSSEYEVSSRPPGEQTKCIGCDGM